MKHDAALHHELGTRAYTALISEWFASLAKRPQFLSPWLYEFVTSYDAMEAIKSYGRAFTSAIRTLMGKGK